MKNATHTRINRRTGLLGMAVFLALIAMAPALKAQNPKHPLDGLTSPEYWATYEVLRASGKVDADTPYPMVQLKEPPKEEVLAWKPGQPLRRAAFVVVWKGKPTFEAVVDLKGKKLVSWTEVKGVQPNMLRDEEALPRSSQYRECCKCWDSKRPHQTDLARCNICDGADSYKVARVGREFRSLTSSTILRDRVPFACTGRTSHAQQIASTDLAHQLVTIERVCGRSSLAKQGKTEI
jgi:Copper amine oxidase, N2 domain